MSYSARIPLLAVAGAAAACLLLPALDATGQDRRMMVVERDDDGGGPEMLSITLPDMKALLTPDYVMDDLPVFRDTLHLSDPQHEIVRARLRAYLEAFATLRDEHRATMKGGPMVMLEEPLFVGDNATAGGPDGDDAGGETLESIVRDAFGGGGGDFDVDVGGGPVAVMVGVTAGGPGDGGGAGAGPGPEAEGDERVVVWAPAGDGDGDGAEGGGGAGAGGVRIAISGDGDMEIPAEMVEKLEARAKAMAARLEERLAEAEANGDGEIRLDGFGGPGGLAERRAELETLVAQADALRKRKDELGSALVRDVQLQLAPDQMERWPRFERAMTRKKTLPRGRLDGERTDLFRLVDRADLDAAQREAVASTLDAYALDLDAALKRRNEYLDRSQDDLDAAMSAGDIDAAIAIAERAAKLRVRVRDVNARFADTIAHDLGDGPGAAFRALALEHAHPRIYQATPGGRAFDEVEDLPDLGEDARVAVTELRASYEADLGATNESIRRAVLEHQPDEPKRHMEAMRAELDVSGTPIIGHLGGDDPIREAFGRRRDLDRRYIRRLTSILGPRYEAMIPDAPVRREPIVIEVGG